MGFHPSRQAAADFILDYCKERKQVLIQDIMNEIHIDYELACKIIYKMIRMKLIHRPAVVGIGRVNDIISIGPAEEYTTDGCREMVPVQLRVKNWQRGEHKRNEFESFFFGGANVQV